MKPILFSENSTTFTTNGIGRLSDAFECIVTEERNGIYELEMTYPMEGAHYSDIAIRKIIVAKPSANASPEPFRVYKITKPINGKVKIYAQHISYDLSKNTTMPFTVAASATACNTTLQGLKSNAVETCPFTFWTDVTTVASYSQKIPASIKQRLGGIEGSVLDQFGGEYEYVGLTVKLWRSRGSQRDITLRYGKNITDLQQEENIANTVTGVVPFWTDIDNTVVVTLTEKAVYSSHASQYSNALTVPLDLSQEWENQPTQTQLRDAATIYVNQDNFGIPTVSTKVDFVNLADTEEYKDILPLQNVNLCDTIKVQFEKLGIDTTAKIVKTTYNVLAERYDSIEVGSLRSNLASTITDIEKNSASSIEKNGKRIFAEANSEAQDLVNNATAWLTSSGGYVIAVKNNDGSWKELLFLDTNDVQTAHNVLRINQNGIGFSSNGVGGPYTQAWTLDGKMVIGGTNAPSLTCYDSGGNIIFQASRSGLIWNANNTSLDRNGKLTASDATLSGKLTSEFVVDNDVHKVEIDFGSIEFFYNNQSLGKLETSNIGLKMTAASGLHFISGDSTTIESTKSVVVESKEGVNLKKTDNSGNLQSQVNLSSGVNITGNSDVHLYRNAYDGNNNWIGSEITMSDNNIYINPGNNGNGDLKIRKNQQTYIGKNGEVLSSASCSVEAYTTDLNNICVNMDMEIWEEDGVIHWRYGWDIVNINYVWDVGCNFSTSASKVRNGIVTTN